MTTSKKSLILILICLISSGSLCAQGFLKIIDGFTKTNDVTKAFEVIDKYEDIFEKNGHKDSLVMLYNKKLVTYRKAGDLKKAKSYFHEILPQAINLVGNTSPHYYEILNSMGRICSSIGEFDEANTYFDEIISRCEATSDTTDSKQNALLSKAYVMIEQGDLKSAIDIAEDAEKTFHSRTDTFRRIQTYGLISYGYSYFHDFEKALDYSLKNMEVTIKKYGYDHVNFGISCDAIANIYSAMSKYGVANGYYDKAKKAYSNYAKKNGNTSFLKNVIGNIGINYFRMGEYGIAENYMLQALQMEVQSSGDDHLNLVYYYDALTENSIRKEDFDDAKKYNNKALKIIASNPNAKVYDEYYSKGYTVNILMENEKLDEALGIAQDIKKYNISIGEEYTKSNLYNNDLIAAIYMEKKEYKNALSSFKKSEEITDSLYFASHPDFFLLIYNLMVYHQTVGDTSEFKTLYQDILERGNNGTKPFSFKNLIPNKNLLDIAILWAEFLSEKESLNAYFRFLDDFEEYMEIHLSSIIANERISQTAEDIRTIYAPAINHLVDNNPEKALLFIELTKSMTTRLLLQSQLIQSTQNKNKNIKNLQAKYLEMNDSDDYGLYLKYSDMLTQQKAYKDSLFLNDRTSFNLEFGLKNFTATTIKNVLHENEVLLEYAVMDSLLYIFTSDGSETNVITTPYLPIEEKVSALIASYDVNKAKELYQLLIPESHIKGYEKILIIPDGKLFYLNFEILQPEESFLLMDKTIRYAYSFSILNTQKEIAQQSKSTKKIIAFSPGFSEEMKLEMQKDSLTIQDSSWFYFIQQPFMVDLSKKLSSYNNSDSYLDKDANENNYNLYAENYKIIHFGTHGLINNESPLFSKFIFVKDSLNDGYMHTYEIFGQEINADLAVLSACNSGNGKLQKGEGVISLAHAFTTAGCPSILMTLWEVDEKTTAEIISNFYDNIKKGQKKSIALRNAKIKYLEDAPASMMSPYYWAGLVIIGDDTPVFSSAPSLTLILGAIVLILLLISLLFRRYNT